MKIYLPSTTETEDKAWVILDKSRLKVKNLSNKTQALVDCIVSWNLEDKLTPENIVKLPMTDINYIHSQIYFEEMDREARKNLIVALDSASDGKNVGKVPFEFMQYQYRKVMGISYQELMDTPLEVFWRDMDYINIEAQIGGNK
jgi:hypothetical protein